VKLIDERTPDGSRHFARWSHTASWEALYDHVRSLPNAEMVNFVSQQDAPPWLNFTFRGHHFVIHSHEGQSQLFVRDPQCSDLILYQVGRHFEMLLGEAA
jgi:hypothetical protein